MVYDKERYQRRIQMEIDRLILHGAQKDWMTVRGYTRTEKGSDKDFLPATVAINPRVDMEAGTIQLVLADGSRVLELDVRQAKTLVGLLQSFLYPKAPNPRQRELVKNVDGVELARPEAS